jgi:hypothetical protein
VLQVKRGSSKDFFTRAQPVRSHISLKKYSLQTPFTPISFQVLIDITASVQFDAPSEANTEVLGGFPQKMFDHTASCGGKPPEPLGSLYSLARIFRVPQSRFASISNFDFLVDFPPRCKASKTVGKWRRCPRLSSWMPRIRTI